MPEIGGGLVFSCGDQTRSEPMGRSASTGRRLLTRGVRVPNPPPPLQCLGVEHLQGRGMGQHAFDRGPRNNLWDAFGPVPKPQVGVDARPCRESRLRSCPILTSVRSLSRRSAEKAPSARDLMTDSSRVPVVCQDCRYRAGFLRHDGTRDDPIRRRPKCQLGAA